MLVVWEARVVFHSGFINRLLCEDNMVVNASQKTIKGDQFKLGLPLVRKESYLVVRSFGLVWL
jgi:hypothetical protein